MWISNWDQNLSQTNIIFHISENEDKSKITRFSTGVKLLFEVTGGSRCINTAIHLYRSVWQSAFLKCAALQTQEFPLFCCDCNFQMSSFLWVMSKSEVEFIALKHDFVAYNTSHIAKHKTETNTLHLFRHELRLWQAVITASSNQSDFFILLSVNKCEQIRTGWVEWRPMWGEIWTA